MLPLSVKGFFYPCACQLSSIFLACCPCYSWHLSSFPTFVCPVDSFPRPNEMNVISVFERPQCLFYSGIVKRRQGTIVCVVPLSRCLSSCNDSLTNMILVLANEIYIWNTEARHAILECTYIQTTALDRFTAKLFPCMCVKLIIKHRWNAPTLTQNALGIHLSSFNSVTL